MDKLKSITVLFLFYSIQSQANPLLVEMQRLFPGASKIEILSSTVEGAISECQELNGRGKFACFVKDQDGKILKQGVADVRIWKSALEASRRIGSGEKLSKDLFNKKDVLISDGMGRELRSIIAEVSANEWDQLEARQTILENSVLTHTAYRRVPQIRKGDPVSVRIHAGLVDLVVSGVSQDTTYVDHTVSVLIGKTKRTLLGKLVSDKVVEVEL